MDGIGIVTLCSARRTDLGADAERISASQLDRDNPSRDSENTIAKDHDEGGEGLTQAGVGGDIAVAHRGQGDNGPVGAAGDASAPSSLDFGIEPFQLHPGIFDAELPIDAALVGVRFVRPSGDFSLQFTQLTDAAVPQTLAR